MYPDYIRAAAQSMAENMEKSEMPLYGESLRLPDRKAVIAVIKEEIWSISLDRARRFFGTQADVRETAKGFLFGNCLITLLFQQNQFSLQLLDTISQWPGNCCS